jgi:anaerobic ribonucleoside-triphosphate reductase
MERRRRMTNNRVKNVDGMVGEGVKFERVRRITGYLTGDVSRWNNGKTAELKDRRTHSVIRKKSDCDREER